MAEHVEDDAAAILLAVVPRWPLRRLPVALEHPIAELAAHREDAPEEAGLDQHLELEQPGKKELVLHHAVLDASRFGRARHVERIRERLGDRLLAINVLAGRDRLAQELGAQLGGGGVEEQRVLAVLERGVEVAGPAREPVRLRQLRQLCLVAADEDRVGHHPVAVLERNAALRADGQNRADQMLGHAHAAGDAVHDDAEPLLRHFCGAFSSCFTPTSCPRKRASSIHRSIIRNPVDQPVQLSSPRKRGPITTGSGIWVSAFAETTGTTYAGPTTRTYYSIPNSR